MELARAFTGWTVKDHFWRGRVHLQRRPARRRRQDRARPDPGSPAAQARPSRCWSNWPRTQPPPASLPPSWPAASWPTTAPAEIIARAPAPPSCAPQGDITAVLRVILLDGLLASPTQATPKFKRPVNFVVSALRQLNAETDGGAAAPRLPGADGPDALRLAHARRLPRPHRALDRQPDAALAVRAVRWRAARFRGTGIACPPWPARPAAAADQLSRCCLNQALAGTCARQPAQRADGRLGPR